MERDWGRAGIELSLDEVMADPIVHLVMRRDQLTPDDLWVVIDEIRRRHRLRTEETSSRMRILANENSGDVSQSALQAFDPS